MEERGGKKREWTKRVQCKSKHKEKIKLQERGILKFQWELLVRPVGTTTGKYLWMYN